MANIETGGGAKKDGKVRSKKLSTRVDFTPLVDLAMLLITFFMLTTTMAKPKVMELTVPANDKKLKEEEKTVIKESSVITLLLIQDNRILYYFGRKLADIKETNYSKDGIRKILLDESRKRNPALDSIKIYKQQLQDNQISQSSYNELVKKLKSDDNNLIVVIKTSDKAKYDNLVNILDEMLITNIGKYAIVDISKPEINLINTKY
ncbi:MAG: ExbD/TolR family protein [Solitalea-like symbiont of Tyrophagus putrescentiae]